MCCFHTHGVITASMTGSFWSDIKDWLLPIIAVITGVFLEKGLNFLRERKRIHRTGKDFVTEVQLLDVPIKKQQEYLDEFIADLKKKEFTTPKLTFQSLLDNQRFKTFNRSDIVEFFFKKLNDRKEAIAKSNKIFASLDIIAFHSNNIQVYFNQYLTLGTIYFEKWEQNLNLIVRFWSMEAANLEAQKKNPDDDSLLNPLFQLINEYINKEDNKDMYFLREKFFEPLIHLCIQYRTDPRINDLRNYNFECNQSFRKIDSLRQEMDFKYSKIKEALAEQMDKVSEDIKTVVKNA